MIAEIRSGAVLGIDGYGVSVEIDLARGLPSFTIVGLPNAAVRESRERVTAAIRNCGFKVPQSRITVNLAPADLRKEGAAFDLPIAVGVLIASGQVEAKGTEKILFMGELALDGRLKRVRGVLPVICHAREAGCGTAVIPAANAGEAAMVSGMGIAPCGALGEVLDLLRGGFSFSADLPGRRAEHRVRRDGPDYAQVLGQETAKRALQVAAAGGHHVLMSGPPGSGKTMLAMRLPSILPPMDEDEALECAKIASVAGKSAAARDFFERPFRAPHHSASDAGLVGGGRNAMPGEITLAHNGVLFLDEFTEFKRNVLETLRQPAEEGSIVISRANASCRYPARFHLVAAMNPCPCGYDGSESRPCACTPAQVQRYLSKVSGPLLDRIAIHLAVKAVPAEALAAGGESGGISSEDLAAGVMRAAGMQKERYGGIPGVKRNSDVPLTLLEKLCPLGGNAASFLLGVQRRLVFSARTRKNIILVARTIADIDGRDSVMEADIAEAVQYRLPSSMSG